MVGSKDWPIMHGLNEEAIPLCFKNGYSICDFYTLTQSYISDFVWRKKFNGPDIMFHLWSQIAELYKI
uniref:Uncharacterized protein n=1 Tax=Ditylenchus dipsaci TaxID=166011 RepID=A0A915ET58_9BILA